MDTTVIEAAIRSMILKQINPTQLRERVDSEYHDGDIKGWLQGIPLDIPIYYTEVEALCDKNMVETDYVWDNWWELCERVVRSII